MFVFYNKWNIVLVVFLVALIAGATAFAVISYSFYSKKRNPAKSISSSTPIFISEDGKTDTPADLDKNKIYVHVTGEVKNPDVYKLPAESRVIDAINAAGGTTAEGYKHAHNLAAVLEDGMKIYVPTKDEWEKEKEKSPPELVETGVTAKYSESTGNTNGSKTSSSANSNSDSYSNSGPKPLPTEKISINNGDLEDLMLLPGIGEAIATNIIEYRKENGKFETLEDLMKVSKIGEKTYEKLLPYIKL